MNEDKKKSSFGAKRLTALLAAVILCCAFVFAGCGKSSSDDADSSSGSSGTSMQIDSTLEYFGSFDDYTYSGSGSETVELPEAGYPFLLTAESSDEGSFYVCTVDSSGTELDVLIDTTGEYSGTVTNYTGEYTDAVSVSVTADGEWGITITPLSEMTELENGQEYTGDGVYMIDEDELESVTITNSGEGDYKFHAIGISSAQVLAEGTGELSDTFSWTQNQCFFIVTSDGTWSISW